MLSHDWFPFGSMGLCLLSPVSDLRGRADDVRSRGQNGHPATRSRCPSLTTHSRPAGAQITGRSYLRHPGLAHAIVDTLALRPIGRIVAWYAGTVAVNGEVGIEGKPRRCRGPGLLGPPELC